MTIARTLDKGDDAREKEILSHLEKLISIYGEKPSGYELAAKACQKCSSIQLLIYWNMLLYKATLLHYCYF